MNVVNCSRWIAVLLWTVPLYAGDETVTPKTTVEWSKVREAGQLKSGEVVAGPAGQPDRLKIASTQPGPQLFPLCEIDSPAITTDSYAIRGRIQYDQVIGTGFLEMWNHFPDGSQYFSRTLDTSGPLAMVTGTSAGREFLLPFHTLGKAPAPKKLVLNLVLNGPGTVEIGPLELIPIEAPAANMSGTGNSGWSSPKVALVVGLIVVVLGALGSWIGILTQLGKGKNLVLGLSLLLAALGFAVLLMGAVAVITGQPYEVSLPLLVLGGLSSLAGIAALIIAPGRFRTLELRRMQAMD
jgi:hypothetical protein